MKRLRWPLLVLSLALACAGPTSKPLRTPGPVAPLGQGVHDLELGVDPTGESRTARVIWPKGPIHGAIWVFHGGRNTTIDELAPAWRDHRERGFVLVFPQGQRSRPDEGAWFTAPGEDSVHVAPLLRLHDRLTHSGVKKHLATGFSSGGHMTWRLACEQPERFEAFVPIGSFLLADVAERCWPDPVRPLLLVAMADDPVSPYAGKPTPEGRPHSLGADASLERMAALATCSGAAASDPVQGGAHLRWPGCELEHVRLERGGHRWPHRGADLVIDFFDRVVR